MRTTLLLLSFIVALSNAVAQSPTLPFNSDMASNNSSAIIALMGGVPEQTITENNFVLLSYYSNWLNTSGKLYFLIKNNSNTLYVLFEPSTLNGLAKLQQQLANQKMFVAASGFMVGRIIDNVSQERRFTLYNNQMRQQMLTRAKFLTDKLKENDNALSMYYYNNYFIIPNGEIRALDNLYLGIGFVMADEYVWDLLQNN